MNITEIINGYHSARSRGFLNAHALPLIRRGMPEKLAIALARGLLIFDGHQRLLNNAGQVLSSQAWQIFHQVSDGTVGVERSATMIEEISPSLPTLQNPQLGIWKKPSGPIFDLYQTTVIFRRTIIVSGCYDPCLFCNVVSPTKTTSMPFPMVAQLEAMGLITSYTYVEPFGYFDRYFNATLSHVHLSLVHSRPSSVLTHGSRQPHALAAYREFQEAEIEVRRLTMHLWHKALLPQEGADKPREEKLEEYAQSFIDAIEYLSPRALVFVANDNAIYPHLRFDYLYVFFQKRVWQRLSSTAKRRYAQYEQFARHPSKDADQKLAASVAVNHIARSIESMRRENRGLIHPTVGTSQKQLEEGLQPDGRIYYVDYSTRRRVLSEERAF